MLDVVRIDGDVVWNAQRRLLAQLKPALLLLRKKFGRTEAQRFVSHGKPEFEIHQAKVLYDLVRFLRRNDLAWPSSGFWRHDPHQWLVVHPRLGRAIMSTIAIAIAKDKGLDVVTDDRRFHDLAVLRSEEEIIRDVLGDTRPPTATRVAADQVAQFTIAMYFDVRRLTAADVAAIVGDGKDLRRFRESIEPIARRIPELSNPEERQRRMHDAANEIFAEWQKYKRSFSSRLADMLFAAAGKESLPKTVLDGLAVGAVGTAFVRAQHGLAFAVGVFNATRLVRRFVQGSKHPMHYLTRISKSAPLVGIAGCQ